jgi:archaellum component FlaF (FlaF/FlaG flagellin family)
MKRIIPYITLVLMIASILVPVGIGYTRQASANPNLQVAAGELNIWSNWSINPCKYTYQVSESNARVSTTISNLSDKDMEFDLGDGSTVVIIPAKTSLSYSYEVNLTGQTERIRITKLADKQSDVSVQEALVLKIEPR